jgi:hypothetical protein
MGSTIVLYAALGLGLLVGTHADTIVTFTGQDFVREVDGETRLSHPGYSTLFSTLLGKIPNGVVDKVSSQEVKRHSWKKEEFL